MAAKLRSLLPPFSGALMFALAGLAFFAASSALVILTDIHH